MKGHRRYDIRHLVNPVAANPITIAQTFLIAKANIMVTIAPNTKPPCVITTALPNLNLFSRIYAFGLTNPLKSMLRKATRTRVVNPSIE